MSPFITALPDTYTTVVGEDGAWRLPRYAVWKWDPGKGKPQVVDCDHDLVELAQRHGLEPKAVTL